MRHYSECLDWFEARREFGAVFVRVAFGAHLMYVSMELFQPLGQQEFANYLGSLGIPFPLLSAYLAHLTEWFGGLCLILGLWIRPVSLALIFNFAVALAMALQGFPYLKQFQAIQMLAVALFTLFHGAGALSLDGWWTNRRARALGAA